MSDPDHIRSSIHEARDYLRQHPEEARYRDSAASAVLEAGLRCTVEGPDGATLVTDMPQGVGGGATAPSPGWLTRAGLASCDATVIAMRAAELGVVLRRIEVVVDSESDDRGLLASDDAVTAGPESVRVRVRVSADGVEDQTLREIVEWADQHSPVADAVRRAVPTTVEIEDPAGAR